MTKVIRYILFLSVTLAALYSCGVKEMQKTSPFINDIKSGEAFCIILPEDHTKAEMWQLSDTYNKRIVDHVSAVWHGNEKGIYFHFEGKNKGKTELLFFKRKFADTTEKKSFTVKVSQD